MQISQIEEILNAELICGEDCREEEVLTACGSEMMSDVLAFVKDQAVLLTGLINPQVVRTAMMMDMRCLVLVRDKRPTEEMKRLASENHIAMLSTPFGMYDACGRLYANGLGIDQ